jgi:gluconate 2-dehydrogenase gamma chain
MLTASRRELMAGAMALFGSALAAPLARAATAAATAPDGFTASHAAFTAEQRALVAALSERIIPTTDTPGAIAAGVPGFIEMMLADWYEPTDRNDFMAGLGVVDGYARVRYAKVFAALTPDAQDAILTTAMENAVPGLSARFFEQCRQMVILGYYSSEIGCTQERAYLPVPSRYDGAYPYAEVRRIFSS